MSSALIRTVRFVPAFAAVCLGALSPAPGAPPPHLAPEDLTAAVRFEEDRPAAQLVAAAEEALRKGDHTRAVTVLQEVLDSGAGRLVSTPNGYQSALQRAWNLLRAAPPDVLEQYRRHSTGAATAELKAAQADNDERDLVNVVLRFRFTRAGESALETLAQRRLDSGRFPEAAALYEELIAGAPDAGRAARSNPAALHAWILALHQAGDDQAALAVAGEFVAAAGATGHLNALLDQIRNQAPPATSGDDQENGDVIRWLPSGTAAWEFAYQEEFIVPADMAADLLPEFGGEGISPFLHACPLEVDDGIVIRTPDGVARLDFRTGGLVWRWPALRNEPVRGPNVAGPFGSMEAMQLLEREFGDGVHTRLTGDPERVYFLDENPDESRHREEQSLSNALVAVDAGTGEELWVRGRRPDEVLQNVFFRGAPTVYGGEILILGDRAASTELFVLDASSGLVNWSVPLCANPASPVRDDRRLAQECRVLVTAGKAVCPTGGGGLVAVDLLSHTVCWAYRYAREPLYEDDFGSQSQAQPRRQLVWPDSWSATDLAAGGGRIVLASGESDVLHVLDARNGALLWTRPRGDAVFVGCVTDSHVVLVHPHHVSAVALDDGTIDWTVAVEQPSGRGCVVNRHYLLPLMRGGAAAVRLTDGKLTRTYSVSETRPHIASDSDIAQETPWRPVTLVRFAGQVVEQSAGVVRRLVDVGEALDSAALAAADDPEDSDLAIRHAARLREAGDFDAAADVLLARTVGDDDESERDRLRRQALEAILTRVWLTSEKLPPDETAEQLLETDADRVRFQICRLRSALRDSTPAAIDAALTLVDLGAEQYYLEREDGTGWVRLDRQAQAWLGQLLRQADGPTQLLLEAALAEALEERSARSGDLETHRLLCALDHIPAAQQLRVSLPPRWSTIGEFIQFELELEQLAARDDHALAAGALAALTELYEAHSDYRQAARTLLRLRSLAAESSVETAVPDVPDDSPLRSYLDDPSLPAWPEREPDINSAPGVNDDPLYFTLPEIVAEQPALVDGLTVSVARNGGSLAFTGGSWNQQWQLDLPPVRGIGELMRNEVFADLRRGWTFGNLLVIQIGGNVFGVAPLDRNGEPSAELIWPDAGELISCGDRVAKIFTHPQSDIPRPHGFAEQRLLLDGRLQPVGQVGPVRRVYFCVRRGSELTAFHTATGARLWTRSVPPAARCHGDDDHLVLIRPDTPEVSLLRALDGALLGSYQSVLHDAELLSCYGCRALVLEPTLASSDAADKSDLSLTLCDLTNGESVWSRRVPDDCVCFPVDDELCGLLEPDGTVRLIELATGEDFAVEQVERPDPLTGVRTIRDRDTLFLLLTKPVDDPAIQATVRPDGNSPNTGIRNVAVNGGMHAFERSSGELRWSRDVDNAVVVLDQPQDVPVLVFKELRAEAPGSSLLRNRMRVIDKRSGETLLDETSTMPSIRYVIQRNREEAWLEVQCADRLYRFDYGERTEGEKSP